MKAKIISSRDQLYDPAGTEAIIFTFRPKMEEILQICRANPYLKQIRMAKFYEISLSRSARMFLDMKEIAIVVDSIQGNRKDRHGDIIETEG